MKQGWALDASVDLALVVALALWRSSSSCNSRSSAEPMPDAIAPGDAFTVHPGRDKLLETCRDRFDNVVNFRGEPFVPGLDALGRYPDAQ